MQTNRNRAALSARHERGVALVFVLVMVSIVLVVVAVSSRLVTLGERSARNDRDRQTAFQAAEAALSDAEIDIMGPNSSSTSRVAMFGTVGADEGCSSAATTRGFCGGGLDVSTYNTIFSASESSSSRQYVTYGEFTDRTSDFPVSTTGALPSRLPRYIIEKTKINYRNRSGLTGKSFDGFLVTAVGYGIQSDTRVMLQALISKPMPTTP